MGSLRRPPLLQGFGIPHSASLDLSALDADRASYSESGSGPGLAVGPARGRLSPRIHHAQDRTVEVVVTETGLPGDTLYATASIDGGEPMGWSPPDLLQGAWGLPWPGVDTESWAACEPEGSTYLIAALSDGSNVRVYRFDGSAWTMLVDSQEMEHAGQVALVELPGGRLLLGCCDSTGASLYYSDDLGENWSLYSSDVWDDLPTGAPEYSSMCRMGSSLLWLVGDSNDDLWQYASSDLGSTWVQVDSAVDQGKCSSCFALPDGSGIGITYLATTGALAHYLSLVSPWQPVSTVTSTEVSATAILGSLVGLQDPQGVLYLLASLEGSTWRSVDGGETWEETANVWWQGAGINGSYTLVRGCAYAGGAAIFGYPVNSGLTDIQVTHLQIGGWTNVVPDGGWDGGYTWAGTRDLTSDGWTFAGTATRTTEEDGTLTLSTGGGPGAGYYRITPSLGTGLGMMVELSVPQASDNFRGLRLYRSGDGVLSRTLNFHVNTTSLTITNIGGGGDLAVLEADMTQPMQLLISLDDLHLQVWYRRPGIYSTWTTLYDGAVVAATGGVMNDIRFGNFAASSGETRWRLLAYTETPLDVTDLPGAYLTPSPLALPQASEGPAMAYISAIGGPGVMGESYVIEPRASRGLANALVGESPSPSEVWRSQDTGEQVIAWDLEDDEVIGAGYYLLLDKANFRSAYLEGSTDGEEWTTLAEYDGAVGFSGLGWSKRGKQLRPTGATEGGRYIKSNELAGGHVLYDDGTAAKITANEGGHWSIASTKQARLTLDSPHASSTGTGMALVWPGGVAYGYPASEAAYRYIRVRIPEQVAADDYYEAGVISWGRVEATGQVTSWGSSQRSGANYASTRNDFGTEYRRTRGPVGRTWTFGWQDGSGVKPLRNGPDSTDYISVADGYPALGAYSDVWWSLVGLLEETEYVRPVLWCSRLPLTDGTITDRSLYIFGWLSGDVQIDQSLGWEGSDEHGRISNLTIEELV